MGNESNAGDLNESDGIGYRGKILSPPSFREPNLSVWQLASEDNVCGARHVRDQYTSIVIQ